MKKNIKFYIIAWAILLALFNLIAFISPGWAAFEKYSGSFWTGYIFITLAFVGQLVCSLFAFKEDKKEKFFLSLPLITLSYTGLILTLVFGTLCMLVSFLPYWVAVIICAVILAVYAIAVLKAKAAAEISSATGEKVKAKTFFIRIRFTQKRKRTVSLWNLPFSIPTLMWTASVLTSTTFLRATAACTKRAFVPGLRARSTITRATKTS